MNILMTAKSKCVLYGTGPTDSFSQSYCFLVNWNSLVITSSTR